MDILASTLTIVAACSTAAGVYQTASAVIAEVRFHRVEKWAAEEKVTAAGAFSAEVLPLLHKSRERRNANRSWLRRLGTTSGAAATLLKILTRDHFK